MQAFKRKTELILLISSIIALIAGALIILLSDNLLLIMEKFLETKIFHRDFEISKWADTIYSLIAFPIFCIIFIDALIFCKFSSKSKIILISCYSVVILVFITFCSYTKGINFIDSDMASEILLAKECFLEKTFFPKTWYYSTEMRILNTQLVTAPLFIFTSNLFLIKTISALILTLLLPFSLCFLLNQLGIKTLWLKVLLCLLIIAPWSSSMWKYFHFGNYYIPHVIFAFIYVGLSFTLSYNQLSSQRYKIFFFIFLLLALISGLSGIRYILYFQIPLVLTIISYTLVDFINSKKKINLKSFFISNKPVFNNVLGFLVSCIGYLLNNIVLSRFFSFSQFNTTTFTTIGDVTFSDVLNSIFGILGYRNQVSVFTPSGIINILIYISVTFLILCIINVIRMKNRDIRSIFITFFCVQFIFNSFVYINTEYISRYFILPIAFILPTIAIIFENKNLFIIKKYITLFGFSILLIASSFITFGTVLGTSDNNDKKSITRFLDNSNYSFGYATFWNANVFTFLTNGKIELANLQKEQINNSTYITKNFEYDAWLTPARYYQDGIYENIPIILIISTEEYNNTPTANIFHNGKLVYKDEYYRIYEYDSNQQFKTSF